MKQKRDDIFKETMRNKRKDPFCMNTKNFNRKNKNIK